MSISKETIAEYYHISPEQVCCRTCGKGKGEFLVVCGPRGFRIMGPHEWCDYWQNKAITQEGRKK